MAAFTLLSTQAATLFIKIRYGTSKIASTYYKENRCKENVYVVPELPETMAKAE